MPKPTHTPSKADVKIGRFLSMVLRHKPQALGIRLDGGGWVEVDVLLAALARAGRPLDRARLDHLVATNPKRRYAFSDDGTRIRAVQGHSLSVDLGYAPARPPEHLYHGTVARVLEAIRAQGLKPMGRDHVHLSPDVETATIVGARRGRPVILTVRAGALWAEGQVFHQADNGVWLTAAVPPDFLDVPEIIS
ncbi:MAG: RNA 2'-phosphotransferase [Rhodobacterales bacterium]|nr:RNA 2'-phosphotransferase [Rhodobacterales bacterium]